MNHTVITNKLFPSSFEQKPSNTSNSNTINRAFTLSNLNINNQQINSSDQRGSILEKRTSPNTSDKNMIRPSIVSQSLQHSKTLATLPISNSSISDANTIVNPLNTYPTLLSESNNN